MARDRGLEELIRADLSFAPPLAEKPMFGGLVWLLNGNLLCAASGKGMLVRLGPGNDSWALGLPGVSTAVMGGRPMKGWVRAVPDAFGDDEIRQRLLEAAFAFVGALPPK